MRQGSLNGQWLRRWLPAGLILVALALTTQEILESEPSYQLGRDVQLARQEDGWVVVGLVPTGTGFIDGLRLGDRLESMNDRPIEAGATLPRLEDPNRLVVRRGDERISLVVTAATLDHPVSRVGFTVTGLLFLGIGLYAWFHGRGGRVIAAFLAFCSLGAYCLLSAPAGARGHAWAILFLQSGALGAVTAMLIFVRHFPTHHPLRVGKRMFAPEWLWLGWLGLTLIQWVIVPFVAVQLSIPIWPYSWATLTLVGLLAASMNRWWSMRRATDRRGHRQYALIGGGALVAFMPILTTMVAKWLWPGMGISISIAIPFTAIWPATIAYAMLRNQVAGIGVVYRRGVLLVILTLVFGLCLAVVNRTILTLVNGDEYLTSFIMAVTSFLIAPAALWALNHLDPVLYGRHYNERRVLADATRALASTLDGPTLMGLVLATVTETLLPLLAAIYQRQPDGSYRPVVWRRLPSAHAPDHPPPPLPADHPALASSEPSWCVPNEELHQYHEEWPLLIVRPSTSEQPLTPAWLLGLARRANDVAYSRDDRALLESLAGSLALALDKAHQHAQLVTTQRHQAFLANASHLLAGSLDPSTTLETVVRLALPTLGDACVIDFLEADGRLYQVAVSPSDPSLAERIGAIRRHFPIDPAGAHPVAQVLRQGRSVMLTEVTDDYSAAIGRDTTHRDLIESLRLLSLICVPMVVGERVVGTLSFLIHVGERRYSQIDLDLAEDLARRAALALDNARLYRASNEALAQVQGSEARFRALVQSSSDLICVVSPELILRSVTPSVTHLLGYLPEALVDQPLTALAHPDDCEAIVSAVRAATTLVDVPPPIIWRVRRQEGTWRHIESVITNLIDEPTVGGLVLNSRDVSEHQELQTKLTYQAFHDPLTGLANRALFRARVEEALLQAIDNDRSVTILFVDLDNFKTVNDSFGHELGDQLLITVAQRMRTVLRANDTIARLGGDEFAILLDQIEEPQQSVSIAERLLQALRQPVMLDGWELLVKASIGIATNTHAGDVETLLRNADMAMYTAKSQGKDSHAHFEPQMHVAVLARLDLETELRHALENGALDLFHQPVIDLMTGDVTGLESLLRWRHPTRGLIPAATFIPLAEETGLIVPIGHWAIQETCRRMQYWRQLGPQGHRLTIGVNLSARQLHDPALTTVAAAALADYSIAPGQLIMEITESLLMHDTEDTIRTLHMLKHIGIRLAIDDFGTGYSSLKYMQRLPVDIIKIDKAFVDPLLTSENGPGIARVIIELGETLRLSTVAEGIETPAQADRLRALRCRYGQGYYFSRPLDLAGITAYLGSRPAISAETAA